MRLKVSSAKWRPFCLGLNVLIFPLMTWERTFQHWQRFCKRGLTQRVINVEFWPVGAKETCCIGNKTKIFSLSIDRQLKFWMTAWPKLGNKATENGNSIKYTGTYFTAVKASSRRPVIWDAMTLIWRRCTSMALLKWVFINLVNV